MCAERTLLFTSGVPISRSVQHPHLDLTTGYGESPSISTPGDRPSFSSEPECKKLSSGDSVPYLRAHVEATRGDPPTVWAPIHVLEVRSVTVMPVEFRRALAEIQQAQTGDMNIGLRRSA